MSPPWADTGARLASPRGNGSLYRRNAMGMWAHIFVACCCSFIFISCQNYEIRFFKFRFDCLPAIEHLLWTVCIWILRHHNNCSPVYSLWCHQSWKQAPLVWNQFTALPFRFEVEGFKHNEFVWTFERVDLINLWDHLFLDCRHQIKLELLSTWFEVIDGGT